MLLRTTGTHQLDAVFFAADVHKGVRHLEFDHIIVLFVDFVPAKATLEGLLMVFGLFTRHALMIWLHLALDAEVIRAGPTANSKLRHVFCHFFRNFLPFLVASIIIWLRFWLKYEGSLARRTRTQIHSSLLKLHLQLLVIELLNEVIAERFAQI